VEDFTNLAIGLSKTDRDVLQRALQAPNSISGHELAHLTTLRNQIVHGMRAWTVVDPSHISSSQFICGSSRYATAVATMKSPEVDLLYFCATTSHSVAANEESGRRGFRGFQRLRHKGKLTLNPRKEWLKVVRLLNRLIGQFIRSLDDSKSLRDFVVRLRPFHLLHGAHPPDVSTSLAFPFSA
jgi:hypothetical protein